MTGTSYRIVYICAKYSDVVTSDKDLWFKGLIYQRLQPDHSVSRVREFCASCAVSRSPTVERRDVKMGSTRPQMLQAGLDALIEVCVEVKQSLLVAGVTSMLIEALHPPPAVQCRSCLTFSGSHSTLLYA